MAKIIPVIHVVDYDQTMYNVEMCRDNGVSDIFLIDHYISDSKTSLLKLERCIRSIKTNIKPEIKIGVNYLQLDTIEAMTEAFRLYVDYIWADRSYIEPKTLDMANKIFDKFNHTEKHTSLYFGCVAFKYQRPVKNLEWTCKTACDYMDVITTSGDGTGKPPSLEKIKSMRNYIGDKPLAIASGITPENKNIFNDLVEYMLVASSITDKSERLIESRLKAILK